jgi:hypothetical protein
MKSKKKERERKKERRGSTLKNSTGEEIAELNQGEVRKDFDIKFVLETKNHALHEVKDPNDVMTSVQQSQHALKSSLIIFIILMKEEEEKKIERTSVISRINHFTFL